MFHPVKGELWLRRSIRFFTFFSSEDGAGASWLMNVSPSESACAAISSYPASITYFCVSGRGSFQLEGGQRFVSDVDSAFRVPANTHHILRNELRSDWKLWAVLDGSTGAEAFLHCLAETADEEQLLEEAKAYGLELFLPGIQPVKTDPIAAAETRILYPRNLGFSL